jgi:glycosyltransferase involved in cell wall biosynthesis
MTGARPRVVVVRGHQATPWEMRMWDRLDDRFELAYLSTANNRFEVGEGALPNLTEIRARTLSDRLPGPVGRLAARAGRDRYLGLEGLLADAAIVHSEELGYWFASDAAAVKERLGFKLVQTVWETLPLLDAYRTPRARRNRARVLAATDLFLPTTERAASALALEGVPSERMVVSPPGIDTQRFADVEGPAAPDRHVIISPGRLVWEKGHHDVVRALAAIRRGVVPAPELQSFPQLLIVGAGPEQERLERHAAELGVGDAVEIRSVPYDEMPAVFAGASCMVLASLSSAGCALHPLDVPHCFWEEQFGLVLAEAMAARLRILASSSGAIPEVAGGGADYFVPGDWLGLARALVAGPLSRPPGERVAPDAALLRTYSLEAAAERLAAAYDRLLA